MAAIDDITALAQDVYRSINGSDNDDTGDDLTTFQNDFISDFNLWLDEYETEAYWNKLRQPDYVLATIANTTTYSFPLNTGADAATTPPTYRTPIFNQDKYVKVIATDGSTVLASFKLVDPSQRITDDPYPDLYHPDRATFVDGNIVLSRPPTSAELNSTLVLDVVKYHHRLSTSDAAGIPLLPSRQLAVLGVAKNMTLGDVTKVQLSASFAQKYKDELNKQIFQNNLSNEPYDIQRSDYGYITGSF